MHRLLKQWVPAAFAALVGLTAMPAVAQSTAAGKPIRLVVPFPPSGVADGVARGLAQRLGASLAQTVVVDNKPGANTILGAEQVAGAAPDGNTLLFATDWTLSINPLIYSRLPYDPKAFIPVALVAGTVECLMVSGALPVENVADLVKALKSAPGKYNYGSFGTGSTAQLTAEAFRLATGTDLTHIPYKGVAEIIPALMGNEVQVLFASQYAALPHLKSGKLKVLAVLADKRQPTLPGVPTIAEAGYPDLQQKAWFGVVAPAHTPKPAIDRLSASIAAIAASPDFKDNVLAPNGLQDTAGGSARLAEVLAADRDKYAKLVRAARIQPE